MIQQKKITDSFVKNVVIKCGAPINLVNQEGFRDFMKNVDPKNGCLKGETGYPHREASSTVFSGKKLIEKLWSVES